MARIGVTFFLRKEGNSIWSNGAAQNCVFLVRCLRAAGHQVVCLNAGDGDPARPMPDMLVDGLGIEFVPLLDGIGSVDLLIEAAAQVSPEVVECLRKRGGKAVAFRFGNSYVIETERVIHGKKPGAITNEARFDEVWTNAQHMRTCASYWETIYRAPVRCLPHLWEPLFVDRAVREFPSDLHWGYRPGRDVKCVGIFEPNINIVKTAVVPMLACERVYRRCPQLLGDVYVLCSEQLKSHLTFNTMAKSLDVVKAGRMSFEARYRTPWFMAKYCDVMLAHQWECGLNYAYYEALYGGYPLVHNSDLLPDGIGYQYRDFDAQSGANALMAACLLHDGRIDAYQRSARAYLATLFDVEAHAAAVARVLSN